MWGVPAVAQWVKDATEEAWVAAEVQVWSWPCVSYRSRVATAMMQVTAAAWIQSLAQEILSAARCSNLKKKKTGERGREREKAEICETDKELKKRNLLVKY